MRSTDDASDSRKEIDKAKPSGSPEKPEDPNFTFRPSAVAPTAAPGQYPSIPIPVFP